MTAPRTPLRLTCKQASAPLIARGDRTLGLRERVTLTLHLLACHACPQFASQMATLSGATDVAPASGRRPGSSNAPRTFQPWAKPVQGILRVFACFPKMQTFVIFVGTPGRLAVVSQAGPAPAPLNQRTGLGLEPCGRGCFAWSACKKCARSLFHSRLCFLAK